jgi:D-lactate dehydrogenase
VFEKENQIADMLRNKGVQLSAEAQLLLELREKDNVIFTPHNAFNTREATQRKAQLSIAAVCQFLNEQTFPDPIPIDESERA